MLYRSFALAIFVSAGAVAQDAVLPAAVTLPVSFSKTVNAASAKPGDAVDAVTVQRVRLPGGEIPRGTHVVGHVVNANGFAYDKTPYAQQKAGLLTVHFDAVVVDGKQVPLSVTVRALAGPIAAWETADAASTDLDPLATRTQIGGDRVIPSQSEVLNREGDVVAYNRRDGVYAHLVARGGCDGGNQEVSVAMFSASACGVYGLGETSATERGSAENPSTLTLVSTHGSPELFKHSMALLEVLPSEAAPATR